MAFIECEIRHNVSILSISFVAAFSLYPLTRMRWVRQAGSQYFFCRSVCALVKIEFHHKFWLNLIRCWMCTGFFPSSFDAIEHSLTERKDYVSMINIGRWKGNFSLMTKHGFYIQISKAKVMRYKRISQFSVASLWALEIWFNVWISFEMKT